MSKRKGLTAAWLLVFATAAWVASSDPVIQRSWRTALIERTLTDFSGSQWMLMQSTSAAPSSYSMIQMDMDKDVSALTDANGLFVDVTGNNTFAGHFNLSSAADNSVGVALGVHGPSQFGVGIDMDDTNNTATGIKIAQGGTTGSATQPMLDLAAEEDFLTGSYEGQFLGYYINATLRDVLKFRVDYTGAVTAAGTFRSVGSLGYFAGVGAGGTVTQQTNKTTGVTLNTVSGAITMDGAALAAAAEATFVVTNSQVAAADVIIVNHASAGTAGAYLVGVSAVGAGSFSITVSNVSAGSLSEAIVLNFVVIKGTST